MKLTLKYLAANVHDEADAYLLLEELRWHGTPVCSHCGHDKAYFLKPRNGVTRSTGMADAEGKRTQSVRRVWKCAKCRKQFSVLTGTIFHGTKIPLQMWLMVMVQMSAAKNGISGREVERMHGLTPETAWYMLHRLREAMKREPMAGLLSAKIVADETYIGGLPKNKHQQGRIRPGSNRKFRANWPSNKSAVVSLVNVTTGEVRSRVVPEVTGATLRDALTEQVEMSTSSLNTDAAMGYRETGRNSPGAMSGSTTAGMSTCGVASPRTTPRGTSASSSAPSTAPTTTSAASTWAATWPSSTTATAPASCPTRPACSG